MDRYTIAEKSMMVEWFHQGNSSQKVCDLFAVKYPNRPIPSKMTALRLIRLFNKTGRVTKLPSGPRKRGHIISEEITLLVLAAFEINPNLSTRDIANELDISQSSVIRILKEYGSKAYNHPSCPYMRDSEDQLRQMKQEAQRQSSTTDTNSSEVRYGNEPFVEIKIEETEIVGENAEVYDEGPMTSNGSALTLPYKSSPNYSAVDEQIKNIKKTVDECFNNLPIAPIEFVSTGSTTTPLPPNKRRRGRPATKTTDVLMNVDSSNMEDEDLHDLTAKNIASKLRRLPNKFRIIAEKQIYDILFQAELGNLNEKSISNYS